MKKQRWIIILGVMVLVLAAIGVMASAQPKELPADEGDFFAPPGQSCPDVVVCPDGIPGNCSCEGSPGEIILVDAVSGGSCSCERSPGEILLTDAVSGSW
jgi:hypothetical protein